VKSLPCLKIHVLEIYDIRISSIIQSVALTVAGLASAHPTAQSVCSYERCGLDYVVQTLYNIRPGSMQKRRHVLEDCSSYLTQTSTLVIVACSSFSYTWRLAISLKPTKKSLNVLTTIYSLIHGFSTHVPKNLLCIRSASDQTNPVIRAIKRIRKSRVELETQRIIIGLPLAGWGWKFRGNPKSKSSCKDYCQA
jgi:hypothetical protein